ncbi:MotA/TolQ/ExbB proton channel family protein [Sesbania bispinosa]|nr:MotA/TolQ/ExbB proton channel family protein [Sesbania bispinosa]
MAHGGGGWAADSRASRWRTAALHVNEVEYDGATTARVVTGGRVLLALMWCISNLFVLKSQCCWL